MLYAKIAVGLPVSGPFDYIVPDPLSGKITLGARVWISFGTRRIVGYVVGLSKKSEIKSLKPILELIDEFPILTKKLLLLTKELAEYYYCSWGEAIETAIPEGLRKGKKGDTFQQAVSERRKMSPERGKIEASPFLIGLIHDLDGEARWDVYLKEIKNTLSSNLSAIILLPDIPSSLKAAQIIEQQLGIKAQLLCRSQPKELDEWIRSVDSKVIVGTRSAVFAPLNNLGLIIIDDEDDFAYKQDQAPHYHAREIALMRAKFESAKVILGSRAPSLESFYLTKKHKAQYTIIPRKKDFPEIKIIDTRRLPFQDKKRRAIFSRLLEDALYAVLNEKGKALLFLNRKGFATSATCITCGKIIKCPRCSLNLAYHFKDDLLSCHYCNFKIPLPKICPECNSGYIKLSGAGTEKIESELSRIFPQARIKIIDDKDLNLENYDIFIATSGVIKRGDLVFDLIGVLGIDNALNRVDFRATEKVFGLLAGLLNLTRKRILIQTSSPNHHCFQALLKKDANYFYEEELKQRRQLDFPPYKHMVLVKLRGEKEEKIKASAESLFSRLKEADKDKSIEIISVNSSSPAKLRGNYYWQVLIRSGNVLKANKFLKNNLKDFRHSGIIVTVDVDPL
ncbi:MAG: primosomal protein N' [Candidatus Omnitrophota bacterium]|nr:primosomal protein N' [Candidatus Omnitrophota bacterium]